MGGSINLRKAAGVRGRMSSLTFNLTREDAQFPPHSLFNRLTEKQRQALIAAYFLGYYDVPLTHAWYQASQDAKQWRQYHRWYGK